MRQTKPSINDFIEPIPQPTVDSILTRRLAASKSKLLPPLQSEPMKRQEMKTFMTTFRDTSNLLEHDDGQKGRRGVGVVALPSPTSSGPSSGRNMPPLSSGDAALMSGEASCPKRSLEEVWAKALYDKPVEMLSINASLVRSVNPETGKVCVPRYAPERFERGRVQQPRVELVEVDPAMLRMDGSEFMTPAERREQHGTTVNVRLGEAAMKEAYRARTRLAQTCQKKHPHGVLGVSESPFSSDGGPMSSFVYAENREELARQQRVANRIGKGHGLQRPSVMHTVLAHTENASRDRQNAAAAPRCCRTLRKGELGDPPRARLVGLAALCSRCVFTCISKESHAKAFTSITSAPHSLSLR